VAGNVVKTTDARGYETLFDFTDRYGAPDGEAQGTTPPPELGGQKSYAFATRSLTLPVISRLLSLTTMWECL